MVLNTYTQLKEEILRCIDTLQSVAGIPGSLGEELRDKIEHNVFNLVVLGQFKRGKTSLINALLGAEILPTAIVPLTSIATILTYGPVLNIKVYFNDGRVTEIEPAALPQYVTEKGNPKNEKEVREVIIHYPSPYLQDGVRLIDTPGVGSVFEHNTDVAYQYLPKSDAALFLLSVDQPVSKAELEKPIISEVKEAFTVWRRQEDEKLAGAFETACKRFIGRIDAILDGLLKFSADLFSVPYDMIQAEALWSTKSGFYYRFEEQPGGIEIVAASLTLLLPKFIGEKVVLKKMNEYLYRVFDLHAARIGNDFERRLDKGKLDFRWEMFQRIEATLDGISRAIETGLARKSTGEKAVEERKAQLLDQGKTLKNLRETLERIRQKIAA